MPADRHKYPTLALRFRTEDREWLEAYAAGLGRPPRSVIADALSFYRAAAEAGEVEPVTGGQLGESRRQLRVAAAWERVAEAAREAVRAEQEPRANQPKQVQSE